jgi:DNA-directed RNA polymerase subunit K/omega
MQVEIRVVNQVTAAVARALQLQDKCRVLVSYQISAAAHLNTAAEEMEQMAQEVDRQETMQVKPMQLP